MAVTDPLLDFLAQKANDPRTNPVQRRVAQAIVNEGNPIMDRLAEHGKYLAGGGDGLSPLELMAVPGRTVVGGAGLGLEAARAATRGGVGGLTAAVGEFARRTPYEEADPWGVARQAEQARQAFGDTDADPLTRSLAAREGAGESKFLGAMDMLYDPTNLVPLPADDVAKLLRATKAKDAFLKLLKGVPEAAAAKSPPYLNPILFAPDKPPPASIPAPPGRGGIDELREALWDAVDEAAVPPDVQKVNAFRQAIGEVAEPPGAVPLSMWGNYSTRGNVGRKVGAALPPELGPLSPGRSQLPELFGRRGNAGTVLGPPVPAEASPLLRDLITDLPPTPAAAVDPLLSAPPAASYDDFLQLARGVPGELPAPSSTFWRRLGDPATVGDFFARGVGENLLGQTDSGLYAVKPGALARFVPTSTRGIIDRWLEESYGAGARKAWPNLLKKLGAELTPEGVLRGEQDITGPVLSYLTDRADLGTNRKLVDARYQQLLDELTPAADEAADDAGRMLDEQVELIEASPYFQVFKHFNPDGSLKRRNPITGKALRGKGGKFGGSQYEEVWNIPESGYDDVAATAMDTVGGYNPANAADTQDFWPRARQAFLQYKQLKQGTEIAPSSFAGDIAAGGGGGGGLGITPGMLPVGAATTLVGAGAGGIAGGGLGATAGFVQGEGNLGDRLGNAWEGAQTGAMLGAGVGALGGATLGKNTSGQALRHIVQRSNEAGIAGTKLALAGGEKGAKGGATEFVKGGLRYWAGQVVRHPKNIFNDELWNDVVTGALTPRSRGFLRAAREGLAERAAMTDEWDRLPQSTMDLLALEGIDKAAWQAAEKLHGKGKGLQSLLDLGTPLSANMEDGALSMAKEIGYSTGLSFFNPQGFAQNALGVIAGGPVKGAVNTYWRQFFNSANGILNNSFRHAALAGEAGKFRALGRQALIDAGQTQFAQFADDGMFSTAEVAAKLGPKEAAVWAAVQKNARELAQERVRFLFGDYGRKGMIENALGKLGIPFVSWAMRAYPVAAEMAVTHPVIALGIYHATKALAQGAGENGRPGYTAGSIPVRDEAGLLTGGQSNTTYLNLINSISPVGGEAFKGAEDTGYDKSTYQAVNEGLDRIGLPGFGPVPAALAYIMGFDFRGPSALSRTQGLENALGLIPGNPDLPDIGGGALRAARGGLSPLVAGTDIGALLGAQADPTPEQYDPIGRRYAELVVERTGKRLNDPVNKAYLLDLAFGRGGLYAQAEREALLGGAARNLASLSSPVGAVAQTDTARHAKQATAANPFTFGAVSAIPQGTAARREAERGRKAALASDPWIEPYSIGGQAEAEDLILREIAERYRSAGARLTPAGLAEQLRLMTERAERTRIR